MRGQCEDVGLSFHSFTRERDGGRQIGFPLRENWTAEQIVGSPRLLEAELLVVVFEFLF